MTTLNPHSLKYDVRKAIKNFFDCPQPSILQVHVKTFEKINETIQIIF